MPLWYLNGLNFPPAMFCALVTLPQAVASGIPFKCRRAALSFVDTHGTTVIAVKYKDGVLNVADRRATAGMGVMYDRAEKILRARRPHAHCH